MPSDDHWFAVMKLGTYTGRTRATVEVLPPAESESDRPSARPIVTA